MGGSMINRLGALLAATLALAAGCGSDTSGPDGGVARVEFSYLAPTTVDPSVSARFPECVAGVGRTHIHPSWRGFARFDLTARGASRWEISFSDAPVGAELSIRISDPNACALHPTGASTTNVFANGVLLTRVVPTPGAGTEPGLAFRIGADGTVTP